jgi:hypothetical protein
MLRAPEFRPSANAAAAHQEEQDLCNRVRAEFREMPGMKLTLSQAARLFSIEPTRCARVLGSLVRAGELASDGRSFTGARGGPRIRPIQEQPTEGRHP